MFEHHMQKQAERLSEMKLEAARKEEERAYRRYLPGWGKPLSRGGKIAIILICMAAIVIWFLLQH